MADGASIIDVYMAFEREERQRAKKQDALELEWLAWDREEELAIEQEAAQQEAKEREEWRKDPQAKEAERARRSAQTWEGAWIVAGNQRKKAKRRATKPQLVESPGSV